MFFFEKKNQKTLAPSRSRAGHGPRVEAWGNKSFLLLFFKKEVLAFLP
jgi:hypothetical protein